MIGKGFAVHGGRDGSDAVLVDLAVSNRVRNRDWRTIDNRGVIMEGVGGYNPEDTVCMHLEPRPKNRVADLFLFHATHPHS